MHKTTATSTVPGGRVEKTNSPFRAPSPVKCLIQSYSLSD